MSVTFRPLDEAVRAISEKTPIGSVLRSRGWEAMPLELRQRAFFSAGVESARFLQTAQDKLQSVLAMQRERVARGEALIDRSSFIADLRRIAQEEGIFVDPAKRGGLQDITSRKRLGMIFDIQTEQAREYARWKAEQDPDVLDAFPAQELIRLEDRQIPRKWRERWEAAGGILRDGRMIALKSDAIWRRISRFGAPWPPFDYNSGMGLEDVDRDEAERLGLIAPGEVPVPAEEEFNDRLQASVRGLSPKIQDGLKALFGEQIQITGDVMHWRGQAPRAATVRPPRPAPTAPPALRPAGPKVSGAAKVVVSKKEYRNKVRTALAEIDRVHGDGNLSPLPITAKISKGNRGHYRSTSTEARDIAVRNGIEGAELTVAHEIGHWLDHIGIPSPGKFASKSATGLFGDFWKAVRNSRAYLDLDKIPNASAQDYYKRGQEVWARAYAQFIATRSKNPAMLAWLDQVRSGQAGFAPQIQWQDADFAQIDAAIEGIFRNLGWMK